MANNEWELKPEHEFLSATFNADKNKQQVEVYKGVEVEVQSTLDSCGLCDMSFAKKLLISGEGTTNFIHTAFSAKPMLIGQAGFTCLFSGDGHLIADPLLVRTGTQEYLVIDTDDRFDAMFTWLNWLVNIENEDVKVFEGVSIEDVTSAMTPLLLAGMKSRAILEDYLSDKDILQIPGTCTSCNLDQIPSVSVRLPMEDEGYILMVPSQFSRVIWRSLLSFKEVEPIGRLAQKDLFENHWFKWMGIKDFEDDDKLPTKMLVEAGIIRSEADFVGARGLYF